MAAMTFPTESESLFKDTPAVDEQVPANILKSDEEAPVVDNTTPTEPTKEAQDTSEKKQEELEKPREDAFKEAREQNETSQTPTTTAVSTPSDPEVNQAEVEQVQALWEMMEEDFGFPGMPDENKPQSVHDLTRFMKAIIDENAKPSYAHQEVENFDKFVRAGGDPYQYMQQAGEINYDSVQLNNDYTCQAVIGDHLRMMGQDDEAIRDTIDAYQKAGSLQKMANKSLGVLKNVSANQKQEAIRQQQTFQQQQLAAEKKGIEDTVNIVAGMDSIFGSKWGQREKLDLLDYMFQRDQQGATGFSRDLFTDINKAVLAAYVMKNGMAAFKGVEMKAQIKAVDKFRQTIARDNIKQNVPNAKQKRSQNDNKKSFWDNI